MRFSKQGLAGLVLALGLVWPGRPVQAASVVIFSGRGECRDIALSFDVEFAATTQELADTVDALGIRTTWFFLGDSVDGAEELVRQVAARHQIGNHTLHHPQVPSLSHAEKHRQLAVAEANIARVAGVNPRPFWRPPYGEYDRDTLAVAGEEGYPYTLMWSIDTRDWDGPSVQTIRRRIVEGAFPGAIVLQHGFPPNTIPAVRLAVPDLRARGYQFLTISEILGIDRHVRDFGGDTYIVQDGDIPQGVAACHNLPVARLLAYNEATVLVPGQTLRIPRREEILVRVDGTRQSYPVNPRLSEGKAMAHVRMAEQLGGAVSWTGAQVVITKGEKRAEIAHGQRLARVDGAPVDMGAPALREGNFILVPVRFLAEQMGAKVDWDQPTYTAVITR